MVEENDFDKGKSENGICNIDSKDVFSDFNVSDGDTSDIFNAIMNSDIPNDKESIEAEEKEETSENDQLMAGGDSPFFSNDILTNKGSAGLDDDPFGDSLFAETSQPTAGVGSDNPFAELENEKTASPIDDGNPFAEMSNGSNPFSQMEKADKSKKTLASSDDSVFDDVGSPFSSMKPGNNQEDTSIDDFLKSIS